VREASLVQRLTTAGSRDTMQGREVRTLKGGVRSCAIKHVVSLAAGQQTATCCDSDSEDCVGYNHRTTIVFRQSSDLAMTR
jgi:hypothetical protein